MSKIYPYAVIRSSGCTGSGSHSVTSAHQTAEAAKAKANQLTREYRKSMAKHGGSSGGYIAVEWNQTRDSKFWDDMRPASI